MAPSPHPPVSGRALVFTGLAMTVVTLAGVSVLTWLAGGRAAELQPVATLAPTAAAPAPLAAAPAEAAAPAPSATPAVSLAPTSVIALAGPGATEPPILTPTPSATPEITRILGAGFESPTPTVTPTGMPGTEAPLYARATSQPRALEPFYAVARPAGEWPAPRTSLTASKIGLHSINAGDPLLGEFLRRTPPRVIKAVGNYGWLAEVKALSPETVTIARITGDNTEWVNALSPREAAERYIARHLREYQLNPAVDYWEGWNEYVWSTPEQIRWYAEFEAERACQMQALGYRAAVGGFSVGVPEYDQMADFLPALEAAHRCGGLFHLHEYNRPMLMCAVRGDEADLIPGAPFLRIPAGPLTFRYRIWYEFFLKPRGIGDLPLVLSEYGIDRVQVIRCEDPPAGRAYTWKDYGDWWVGQGHGVDAPHAYLSQLAWADRELRHDEYVLGATVFTVGARDPGQEWHPFDLHDVLLPLANYLASQD